jgi:CubicO group peptidase (beta-lactamase class C family)
MSDPVARAIAGLKSHLDREPFSGTLRISAAGGFLFEHAGGLADRANGVPNQIDTRFGIASVTKMLTGTAVCRLVDLSETSFETRVVDILPAEKRPSTLDERVTLHHLLTHTSGIADYFDEETLGAAAYDQLWLDNTSYLFTEPIHFLRLFGDLNPLALPGQETRYSNAAFVLLAIVLEELTGERFVDHIEEHIFRAAGMNDSAFLRLDEINERTAVGYVPTDAGGWRTNHYSIPVIGGGDGGAFSTVRDLARFIDALENLEFFGPATWELMSSVHADLGWAHYGYGLTISKDVPIHFGHGGADPGTGGRVYRYPQLDTTVTMLGNTIDETDRLMQVIRAEMSREL